MGWGDWPHAQPPSWRARVFCQGVLPLATISRYLKGAGYPPFAVVAQLQYNCITRVMTRTCDSRLGGRAYDTVGISRHLRSAPGGPSALHQGPLPPFNPCAIPTPKQTTGLSSLLNNLTCCFLVCNKQMSYYSVLILFVL